MPVPTSFEEEKSAMDPLSNDEAFSENATAEDLLRAIKGTIDHRKEFEEKVDLVLDDVKKRHLRLKWAQRLQFLLFAAVTVFFAWKK